MVSTRLIAGTDIQNLPVTATGTNTARSMATRWADPINARDMGATGDGTTDDTAALQAGINLAITNKVPFYIPAGTYIISSPLTVSTFPNGEVRGFNMYGDGDGRDFAQGGTVIKYTGSVSIKSMLQVSAWRAGSMHDFSLVFIGPSSGTPQYGILIPDSQPSALHFARISVWNVSRAFGQETNLGENGEFYLFESCSAGAVDRFWYNQAGQGYVHSFINCSAGCNPGGVYFDMDVSNLDPGGAGCNVWQFNATSIAVSGGDGHSNTTLLRNNNGATSTMCFIGGRIENLTRLYCREDETKQDKATPIFKGMQITVRCDPTSSTNTLKSFINVVGDYDVVTIEECAIAGLSNGTDQLNYSGASGFVNPGNWNAFVEWKNCEFTGFNTTPSAPNPLTSSPWISLPQNVKFCGCHQAPVSDFRNDYLLDGVGSWTDLSGYSSLVAPWVLRQPTVPNSTDMGYYTTLLNSLNSASLLAELDALFVFAAPYAGNAVVNMIQQPWALTPTNSPTFTAYRGYTFNGTNQYLTGTFKPGVSCVGTYTGSQYRLNSANFFVWVLNTNSSGAAFGTGDNGGNNPRNLIYPLKPGNIWDVQINNFNDLSGAGADSSGLWVVSRTAANLYTVYRNGASVGSAADVADAAENLPFTVGLGDITHYFNGQIAVAGWGAGLSGGDVTNLYNALQAFLHSVGAG
jgi:hypothetical protein